MRLGIGTLTYNDRVGLQNLISSIDYEYVDEHFIEDGRFPNQKGKYDYSDDGTSELVKNNNRIHFELLAADESVKRQRYLTLSEEYDIDALIILDSDEYIEREHTDWLKFRNEISELVEEQSSKPYIHNVYSLDDYWYGVLKERPRLWIYPAQMEYLNGTHFAFKNKYHNFGLDKSGRMLALPKKHFSFRFSSDNSYRTKMRRVQRDEYQNWLVQYEKGKWNRIK